MVNLTTLPEDILLHITKFINNDKNSPLCLVSKSLTYLQRYITLTPKTDKSNLYMYTNLIGCDICRLSDYQVYTYLDHFLNLERLTSRVDYKSTIRKKRRINITHIVTNRFYKILEHFKISSFTIVDSAIGISGVSIFTYVQSEGLIFNLYSHFSKKFVNRIKYLHIKATSSFPKIYIPNSLKSLIITGSKSYHTFKFEEDSRLESLYLQGSTNEIQNLPLTLKKLTITNCSRMISLPTHLINLEHLNIDNSKYIKSIPENYTKLKVLSCMGSGVTSLPEFEKLDQLNVSYTNIPNVDLYYKRLKKLSCCGTRLLQKYKNNVYCCCTNKLVTNGIFHNCDPGFKDSREECSIS